MTAIYLRISADPTGLAAGVERQLTECSALAERLGLTYDPRPYTAGGDVFEDNDLSATTGVARPAFEALLRSRPDPIIAWHTDRLVRITRDLERVIDLGVNVHAVTAGHLDLSTPAGRAVARTVTAWATYEGEQRSLRQVAAHRQRVGRGKPHWNRRPYGYSTSGDLIEHEALTVRLAYADFLAGVPLSEIARRLNAGNSLTTEGKAWRSTTVRQLLIKPRNAGIITYRGAEAGPGDWEPIVPEDVYRAAERVLRDPGRPNAGASKGGRTPTSLLTGLALCGRCSATVALRRELDGGSRYGCRRACLLWPREFVDAYVSARIVDALGRPERLDMILTPSDDVERARSEAVALRERMDDLAALFAEGALSASQLRAGTAKLNEKLAAAQAVLDAAAQGTALAGLSAAEGVDSWWTDLELARQRAVVSRLAEVTLMPRGRGVRTIDPAGIILRWRATPHPDAPEAPGSPAGPRSGRP